MYAALLKEVRIAMDGHPASPRVPRVASHMDDELGISSMLLTLDASAETEAMTEAVYVDDCAVPLWTHHADALEGVVQQTVDVMAVISRRFGFRLNFGQGKTEVVCSFVGPGAMKQKQRFLTKTIW